MLQDYKKRAVHRSKIIDGQIKGLIRAIEDEKYCMDILTQSLAVQKSLRSLNKLILDNHLRTHVKEGFTKGSNKQKQELVEELLGLYELSNVRG